MGSPTSGSSHLERVLHQCPVLATSLEMLSWQEPGAIQMGHEEEPAPAGEVGAALQV